MGIEDDTNHPDFELLKSKHGREPRKTKAYSRDEDGKAHNREGRRNTFRKGKYGG